MDRKAAVNSGVIGSNHAIFLRNGPERFRGKRSKAIQLASFDGCFLFMGGRQMYNTDTDKDAVQTWLDSIVAAQLGKERGNARCGHQAGDEMLRVYEVD